MCPYLRLDICRFCAELVVLMAIDLEFERERGRQRYIVKRCVHLVGVMPSIIASASAYRMSRIPRNHFGDFLGAQKLEHLS